MDSRSRPEGSAADGSQAAPVSTTDAPAWPVGPPTSQPRGGASWLGAEGAGAPDPADAAVTGEATHPAPGEGGPGTPGALPWLPGPQAGADPRATAVMEPAQEATAVAPSPPPRKKRWLFAVWGAAVAVLLVAAVLVGEWASRSSEMDAIVAGIEESEAAMIEAMESVSTILSEAGGAIVGATPDVTSEETRSALTAAARDARQKILDAADDITAVQVQPWHHDIIAARESYLAHSHAWQAYLSNANRDPAEWFVDDPDIESTWVALAPKLTAAVPTPSILSLDSRVASILQDSGGDDLVDDSSSLQTAGAMPAPAA